MSKCEENRKKLVVVNDKEIIKDLRKRNDVICVYPLKSFCVGYKVEFPIEEIDDFVLINRILTDDDLNILDSLLKRSSLKGIIFEDLGIISLVKDLKVVKILLLTHIGNSSSSINYYLDYVDSVMVSSDLSYTEIKDILNNVNKPLVLFTYGNIPLMYSRRLLLTNYEQHYEKEIGKDIKSNIGDKYFRVVENDYGTCFYTALNYYLKDYQKLPNVLYYYYNMVFLPKDKLFNVLDDNIDMNEVFPYLLKEKTIYKIKEGGK